MCMHCYVFLSDSEGYLKFTQSAIVLMYTFEGTATIKNVFMF